VEQPRRKVGQEGRQGWRFDETAAGIVDDSHAIARGGEQAGYAGAVSVEFQRIDHAAANAAQQHADRLQTPQRLQEQAAVAYREVATLDKSAGQFARQQHMPVPGGVGVTRGQQCRRAGRHDPPQHVEAKFDEWIDVAEQL
jgi:hypothetical protein